MKKHYTLPLAAACILAVSGCHHSEIPSPPLQPVRIAATITRATELNFETGDQIGLTIRRADGVHADNALLTYSGSCFVSEALLWYNDLNLTSTLYAYHPYDRTGTPSLFRVAEDQSIAANRAESDLLVAVREGVTPSSNAVEMVFDHLLARIAITLDNQSDATVSAVHLGGTVPAARVDVATKSVEVSTTDETLWINSFQKEADRSYDVIVVPQTAAAVLKVYTSDGKVHQTDLEQVEFRSGYRYSVEVILTNIDIEATVGGEINGWNDGGNIGENTGGANAASVLYSGERYSVQAFSDGSVWMAENLRYLPQGCTPSADPTSDAGIWYPCDLSLSALTDEESIAKYGYYYDLETAAATTLDASNYRIEGVQGICPAGWHLPTQQDIESLIASLEGADADKAAAFLTPGGMRKSNTTGKYVGNSLDGAFLKAYLWGTTDDGAAFSEDTKYGYLMFSSGAGSLLTASYRDGMPVRCVQD